MVAVDDGRREEIDFRGKVKGIYVFLAQGSHDEKLGNKEIGISNGSQVGCDAAGSRPSPWYS